MSKSNRVRLQACPFCGAELNNDPTAPIRQRLPMHLRECEAFREQWGNDPREGADE